MVLVPITAWPTLWPLGPSATPPFGNCLPGTKLLQSPFRISGRSLAWDDFWGDIDNPCGVIVDFCGVIADSCGVVAIPEAIDGHAVADADRCATH